MIELAHTHALPPGPVRDYISELVVYRGITMSRCDALDAASAAWEKTLADAQPGDDPWKLGPVEVYAIIKAPAVPDPRTDPAPLDFLPYGGPVHRVQPGL